MAQFNKIQTLQAIIQTGMVPVYYNKEVEIAKQVVKPVISEAVRASSLSLLTGRFRSMRHLAS